MTALGRPATIISINPAAGGRMYRILVSPLDGSRAYWLPAMDVPASMLDAAQVNAGSKPVQFASDIDAAILVDRIRVLIGGRLDIIYRAPRSRKAGR